MNNDTARSEIPKNNFMKSRDSLRKKEVSAIKSPRKSIKMLDAEQMRFKYSKIQESNSHGQSTIRGKSAPGKPKLMLRSKMTPNAPTDNNTQTS